MIIKHIKMDPLSYRVLFNSLNFEANTEFSDIYFMYINNFISVINITWNEWSAYLYFKYSVR